MLDNELGPGGNGWPEYRRLVMADLLELKNEVKDLRSEIIKLRSEMMLVKFRLSILGAISGAGAAGMVELLKFWS